MKIMIHASTLISMPGIKPRRIVLLSISGKLGNITDPSIGGYRVVSQEPGSDEVENYRGASYKLALKAYAEQVDLLLNPEVS